jgi:redox-sensitive bicupin YhaK (pirin superfamily)
VTNPSLRSLERLVTGQATQDGAGVRLTRVLTQDLQQRLDPFLMLDAFGSDDPDEYIAGFPDHPHRGFETITYMITGRMRHRDSHGHEGLLESGGVQWMTAGRGLTHSEMPEQEEGLMAGFQLWLNLPSHLKLCEPGYQDFQPAQIPQLTVEGVNVRVIAGSCGTVNGPIARQETRPLFLDVHFPAQGTAEFTQDLPLTDNAFVYVYLGEVDVLSGQGAQTIGPQRMGLLRNDGTRLQLRGQAGARAIVLSGRPLREPIAQYGPFVMNTRQELMQAVEDFRAGRMA